MEEGKEVWDIARVCRYPFELKKRCGVTKDGKGKTHETNEEKLGAFTAHNLITEPAADRETPVGQRR